MSAEHSAARAERTRALVADGDDAFLLQMPTSAGLASQFGREVAMSAGDALLTSNADTGVYTFPSEHSRCLLIGLSHARLRPLLRDFDAALLRPITSDAPVLTLLKRYAQAWMDTPGANPELQQLAVSHIYDLVAVALGPTRDAAAIGRHGGVRAAQLAQAKSFVTSRLADNTLSVDSVARHLGVTPRYIHMLFETETESFSEFVLAQRLARAHAMLLDPRFADVRISAIALDSGFGDLSYFNRTFRRRFQMTPSAARNTDGPR
jgi:AraC-like DNA-binding protein